MMRATAAAAATAAVLLSGCSLPKLNSELRTSPPAGSSTSPAFDSTGHGTRPPGGPRSQVVAQVTLPQGAELAQRLDSYFENWTVKRNRDVVEPFLASQLPIFRNFDGRPWCKAVTSEISGIRETKWVWGSAEDGLMIFVTGITASGSTRVLVVTGPTAGRNAIGCAR